MKQLIFEDLLKGKYDGLSPGQRKVAEYILQNLERCSYGTLAKISRDTNVSETTVIRLSYALGYNSFSEMQNHIREQILENNHQTEHDKDMESTYESNLFAQILENDIKILKQTKNQLDLNNLENVISRIIEADKVAVVGFRSSYSAASWFASTLGYLRDNVSLVPMNGDIFQTLLSMTENSVVLAISFPRYAKETYKFVKSAKEQGATIISVTDNKLSPIGCISDLTLITNANRDETGYNSISSVISLLNLIVVGVRTKENIQVKKRLQKLEEFYSNHDILFE
ncbi:SIS domain-containing protein [Paenibacillus sp. LMG 31456]|uniref:SIS domain-containing protein n=1 Tax=Paenibacillus foliorum TaxID=2654974 RepID=A0A972H4I5_9BACL|nr:MurR/RpiR family transcriptional regulator [Paenibacillus foliorum]NOU96181.1 SIS domain-containing protein [Paenibacillus foliorum]